MTRLCAFLLVLRIGEASNPGPMDSSFILGVANPSGLRSKAPYVMTQMEYGDLWAFSETHLSSKELASFNAGLKFAGSGFYPLVGGHPVPVSQSNAGRWRGVGVLSKTPTRKLPNDWPPEIQQSCRAMAITTLVDDIWLSGGVVYGEPESHLYPDRLRHTEALLNAVVSTVGYLSSGPRFIAGDWNVNFGELPAFDLLAQAGFKDLQDVAAERWGQPLLPTCKNSTRRDYCFISPELQALLQHVSVLSDVWPDHVILQGHFARLKMSVPRDIWRVPGPFPWPSNWEISHDLWNSLPGDPSEKYQALWCSIELTASKALPFEPGKHVKGRASTFAPKVRPVGKCPPLKAGRTGDFSPQFFGSSFRHAQWIRQVRRLQAYLRHVQARDEVTPYAAEVWHSILVARGFVGGFAAWWESSPSKTFGAPFRLPWQPPEKGIAACIFETMTIEVRLLEASLKASSRQYAKLRRACRPNVLFRDLKEPPPQGVDFLLKPLKSQVLEVRNDDCSVVVDPPQDWGALNQIFCNGRKVDVIHADHDSLWLQDVSEIQPGHVVTQIKQVGTKNDLCAAFIDEWKQRWDRHRDMPEERWDVILAFARQHLPRICMSWPSIDPCALVDIVAHKKSSSASGLDGVSLVDLQAMPMSVMMNFCRIFDDAESTGAWPSQLLEGKVVSLAKNESPSGVMDYRPITILGLLYRCWGSYHAKQAIRQMDKILPDTLFGSRPSRYAGQVWAQLLWAVENATACNIALSGVFADIQKAFNCLPRLVIFEAAAILGVPMKVLTAWAGALSQLGRRFQLGQYLSPSVFSSTGMPEGDGLSCLGMVIIDVLFHLWHRFFFPLCQPVSYVDDWTLLTTNPAKMEALFQCLSSFTQAIDSQIDAKKTCMWSVTAHGRKLLQEVGFAVVSDCRSLGAHIQITKKHTNSTQMQRVRSLHGVWPRLRLSAAAYKHKVHAIRAAAWPKGLHAIPATTIAMSTFKSLRAGAMRGLDADGSGVNSHVHLGLIERPETDPQFWAILQTFRMVRECGIPEVVGPVLGAVAAGDVRFASNGITTTLLTRVQTLGWRVDAGGSLEDEFGKFSLFDVSIEELKWRMEFSWLHVVASRVSHRPGLVELDRVDPLKTRQMLGKLATSDQACYRKLLNGAHITQDGKHHCQECDTDVCIFCLSSDSRFHRFWQCPCFEGLRQGICPDLVAALPGLPESMVSYGWALRPSTFHEWYAYLAGVPENVVPPLPMPERSVLHLFTDGSCANPQYVDCRFAAWSIVVADPFASSASILECGILPGIRQTSVRAELYAVARAIHFAAVHLQPIHVWSDCQAVVSRLRRMLLGSRVRPNSPNADLWARIADDLRVIGVQHVHVTKVAAHKSVNAAVSPLEEWCFLHNHFSDQTAGRANLQRPAAFWTLLQKHVQACWHCDRWNADVQKVLLRISKQVLQGDMPSHPVPEVLPETPVPSWSSLPTLVQLPSGATRWYGDGVVRSIVSWWWSVLADSDAPVQWISHMQLFIDFASATGLAGPIKYHGWKEATSVPLFGLVQRSFKQRVKWFIKVVKETMRHLHIPISCAYCKPASVMISMFTGCVAAPWPGCRLTAVDRWLQQFTDQPFRRQSKAIDSLPVPARNGEFPFIPFTSCP